MAEGSMRRLLIIGCLVGLGWLAWRLWGKLADVPQAATLSDRDAFEGDEPRGSTETAGDWDKPAPATVSEPHRSIENAAVPQAAAEPQQSSDRPPVSWSDEEQLLAALARVRNEIVEKVERRPLFLMAEERGVPLFRLLVMSKPELLEAILEAERVPPPDVLPSAETIVQLRELALEVFRRNDEIAAEEGAAAGALDSGEQLMARLAQIRAELVEELVAEPASEPVLAYQPPDAGTCDDAVLDPARDDGEQLMVELAQIRADLPERVERRPLFVMAEQRGVPYFHLFSKTKQELFEAVLEAEGLPPHDVHPSPESAARIREIVAEALRRHAAEEAARPADDKTA
jgi:hypothetical protein